MKPSQAKPSQAKPSQAKPSQAKPSQAKPSQAKPSLTTVLLWILTVHLALADSSGTAISYQGRLTDGGQPANGIYDIQFVLFDAVEQGSALGPTNTLARVGVSNGLFAIFMDFGSGAFNGGARWIEISARTNGGSTFTTMAPRQGITAAPHALYASISSAAVSVAASNINGTLELGNLPGAVLTNGATSVNLAGNFVGNGYGLTNVPAAMNSQFVLSVADVRRFGAVGDGLTDDTLAFQSAQANPVVYVPSGRYLISTLYATNCQTIYGDGQASVIVQIGSGTVINTVNNPVSIRNLEFQGSQDTTDWMAGSRPGTGVGIYSWSEGRASVIGCGFRGFSHSAITATGVSSPNIRDNCALYAQNTISNCYHGIYSKTNEYARFEGNNIRKCHNGLVTFSPNYVITGNSIVDLVTGIYLVGYGSRGHGIISGNQINHCSQFMYIAGVGTGVAVTGNQMMGNSGFRMDTSTNILLAGNTIQSSALEFHNCGTNWFRGNVFQEVPKITHDNDKVIFVDNYNVDGVLIGGNTNYSVTAFGVKNAGVYVGNGAGITNIPAGTLIVTNAAGSEFRVIVNADTNGLEFVPK